MSEQPVTIDEAPELTDPVGTNGLALMGLAPWPGNTPEPVPVPAQPVQTATPQTAAQMRAEAERLLAEADKLDNPQM